MLTDRPQVAPHAGARIETSPIQHWQTPLTSLPMRERELKLLDDSLLNSAYMSLPMRERELKLESVLYGCGMQWSLPMRERELKLSRP